MIKMDYCYPSFFLQILLAKSIVFKFKFFIVLLAIRRNVRGDSPDVPCKSYNNEVVDPRFCLKQNRDRHPDTHKQKTKNLFLCFLFKMAVPLKT